MGTNNQYMALLDLLNKAVAREIQVSIQYMIQHATWTQRTSQTTTKKEKFISSHSPTWFPSASLRKIAIAEMRHIEAIAERLVQLGEEPTTKPSPITIGNSPGEILEINKAEEEGAIKLYDQITSLANDSGDEITKKLFEKIILDEEEHLKHFSSYLKK